jgi:hypothetical protein
MGSGEASCGCGIAAGVFFIIGLPLFLCGCDPELQPESVRCLRYNHANGVIVDHSVAPRTCSECVARHRTCSYLCSSSTQCTTSCHEYCTTYRYYTCYDSYATFAYGDGNATCAIGVDSGATSALGALVDAQVVHPEGEHFTMLVDKNTGSCTAISRGTALVVAGIVFLSLTGFAVLVAAVDLTMMVLSGG